MPCYNPLTAHMCSDGGITFDERAATKAGRDVLYQLQIACSQCIGCRLERSRQWATRCMHEAQMHKHNSFLTLTLDDQHLPNDLSLDHRTFQLFIKRLRQSAIRARLAATACTPARSANTLLLDRNTELPGGKAAKAGAIRYYMAGEYGEHYSRPHYHVCLFGIDFADKIYHRKTPAGYKIYISPTLDKIWQNGFASIGQLTFESAAYVARYILKKQTGNQDQQHDEILNPQTGEITRRKKTYNAMSRGRGIGKTWLEKFQTDVYPQGKVITRGYPAYAPRYYDNIFKTANQEKYETLQYGRHIEAIAQAANNTPERLRVREIVATARASALKRKID